MVCPCCTRDTKPKVSPSKELKVLYLYIILCGIHNEIKNYLLSTQFIIKEMYHTNKAIYSLKGIAKGQILIIKYSQALFVIKITDQP